MYLLRRWGCAVRDAFEDMPYLVGSVARAEDWRDVDVRVIVPDDHYVVVDSGRRTALNVAMSVWGQRATGLPIDFQFQGAIEADEAAGPRIPIGMHA